MNNKPILIVIGSLDIGGTESQLRLLLPELNQRGLKLQVHTLVGGGPIAASLRAQKIEVFEPPGSAFLRHVGPIGKALLVILSATELVRRMALRDVLLVHSFLPAASIVAGVCSVVTGFAPHIVSRRSLNAYQQKHFLLGPVERYLNKKAHVVIANSRAVRTEVLAEGISHKRCATLYNGVDTNAFAPRKQFADVFRWGICDQSKVSIVCVANVIPYKGHVDLLHAISEVRDLTSTQFVVQCFGRDSGTLETLQGICSRLGIEDYVRWRGPGENISANLRWAQIGVLASHEEGLSNAVLEYMASGLAIVATGVGGTVEQITTGETGILVPPGNPTKLANALARLIDDSNERARLGENARAFCDTEFPLSRAVGRLLELYSCVGIENFWKSSERFPPRRYNDQQQTISVPPWIPLCYANSLAELLSLKDSEGARLRLLGEAIAQGNNHMVDFWIFLTAPTEERAHIGLRESVRLGSSQFTQKFHEMGGAIVLLSSESTQVIEKMKREIADAAAVYRPSKFWDFLSSIGDNYLMWGGEAHFKQSINQSFFNFIPLGTNDPQIRVLGRKWLLAPTLDIFNYKMELSTDDPPWFSSIEYYRTFDDKHIVRRRLYRLLVAAFYHFSRQGAALPYLELLDEPKLGNPIEIRTPSGKLISQDLVNSCREFTTIRSALSEYRVGQKIKVAELGSGYGRLAYVFATCLDCQYVMFDIPPALHLAQWYLSELFPRKRVFRFRHVDSYEEIEAELSTADIAFFTSNQLELFPDDYFDVSINISSLHEMRRDQIERFIDLMAQKTRRMIYSKQYRYYENPHDKVAISESDYRFPEPWQIGSRRVDEVNTRFFETSWTCPPKGQAIQASSDVGRQPTVSILLSNYNHAAYLEESLNGICTQTRAADEIIIVDDGSSDNSEEIIEEYRRRFPTIRFLKNERNMGLMYSINRILRAATSDYIVWAAADDRLLPDFLEKSMNMLERHPEAGLCFSQLCVLEDTSGKIRHYGEATHGKAFALGSESHYLTPGSLEARLQESYLWMSGNTVVARRSAIVDIGGFYGTAHWHADWFTFYVVGLRHGVCIIPENLALIRERAGTYSGSGMQNRFKQLHVLRAMAAVLRNPAFADVRPRFIRSPSLLSPFGLPMLWALSSTLRDWDIFRPYLLWQWSIWRKLRRQILARRISTFYLAVWTRPKRWLWGGIDVFVGLISKMLWHVGLGHWTRSGRQMKDRE